MKIVFASRWVDPAGRKYKPGQSADVVAPVARELIARGKARKADPEVTPTTATKGKK